MFKKRLHDNEYRSILLAKGGKYWIFTFIFPKQDKKNLEEDEVEDFRKLAKSYEKVDEKQLATLLNEKDLVEICCESKDKIQK